MGSRGRWTSEARRLLPALRTWRIRFHQEPELSYKETRTQATVVRALQELGVPSTTFPGSTAVVGLIGEDRPGPVVGLRADMDGLPVTETTGLPFASRRPGVMHACGHDVHMACALGAAALLQKRAARLRGPVKLLFQPAEEDGLEGGAGPLIQRGALETPKVDFVVGQHLAPELPASVVGWKRGPLMAAADHFIVRVGGREGHAGYPHRGPDAILAAAEIVQSLQALVSRMREPTDPVVVSVGLIQGGTRHNILPKEVRLEGTVRTFRPGTRDAIEAGLRRRIRHVAASSGARARVTYRRGYPVTVNDPVVTERIARGLSEELGPSHVVELDRPVMGAEDFSRYLEKVPGTFLFLGSGVGGANPGLHSPSYAPPESVLATGTAVLACAVETLQESP